MLERWIANKATVMAQELGYDDDKREVLQYSMTILSTTILGFLAIGLVGALVGVAGLALTAGLSAGILRAYSGGAHATSPIRCNVVGVIIFIGIGLVAKYLNGWVEPLWLVIPIALLGFGSIYLYAPAEAPGKPIQSMLKRATFRRISFSLMGFWTGIAGFLAVNSMALDGFLVASALGICWQSISLTPAGHGLIGFLDKGLQFGNKIS
ncbi:MAG: accessory gene regulator B family protein [Clostridia bacterium]|nr:accessory gene regulator B family protein [Clostridia bacterium]